MPNARERHLAELDRLRAELKTAGYIHAKDLRKRIRRMEKMLMEYDQYRYEARRKSMGI